MRDSNKTGFKTKAIDKPYINKLKRYLACALAAVLMISLTPPGIDNARAEEIGIGTVETAMDPGENERGTGTEAGELDSNELAGGFESADPGFGGVVPSEETVTDSVAAETMESLPTTVTSPAKDDIAGTFSIRASNIDPASALAGGVRVAIRSASGGQDDIRWYPMALSGGTYNASINISNHKYDYGTYHAHVYATQKNGVDQFAGATTVTLTPPPASISAGLNADQTQIVTAANNIQRPGIRNVKFAVWGSANGQNDLNWYTANRSGNNYSLNVPVSNHKEAGVYNIHVYATLTNGQSAFIGASSVTVRALSGTVSSPTKNDTEGTFGIRASDISPVSALGEGVRVAIWSASGGQDDIRWYPMALTGGTYNASINISNHKYDYGTYNAHVYATQKNGVDQFIGAVTVTLAPQPASISAGLNTAKTQISMAANNVVRAPGVRNVQFAVWGVTNGQNDLRWYTAKMSGNNYSLSIPVSNHKEVGVYNIHTYATLTNGQSVFIGAKTIEIKPAVAENVEFGDAYDPKVGDFSVTVAIRPGDAAIKDVQIPIWGAAAGQNDLIWHPARLKKTEQDGAQVWEASTSVARICLKMDNISRMLMSPMLMGQSILSVRPRRPCPTPAKRKLWCL
jgi:hypothetical protein